MTTISIPANQNADVPVSSLAAAVDWTAARAALVDRLAIIAAGGAGEFTPARATLLANLDALLSSRISAADYTAARAAKLDNAGIKSIQQVAAAAGANAITSVTMAKTMLIFNGFLNGSDSQSADSHYAAAQLTSATNVQVTNRDCRVTVVEWN